MNYLDSIETPPVDAEIFYILDSQKTEKSGYLYQVDAFEIAVMHNLKTINGYSGQTPAGWTGINNIQSADYEVNIMKWIRQHDLENVYAYDLGTNTWSSFPDRLNSEFSRITDLLISGEYDKGFAFSISEQLLSILNVIEDHNIEIGNFSLNGDDADDGMAILSLEDISPVSNKNQKPFLLFDAQQYETVKKKFRFSDESVIYRSGFFVILGFENYEAMNKNLFTGYKFEFGNNSCLQNGMDKDGHRELYKDGVSYGPYITLFSGSYEVIIEGNYLNIADMKCTSDSGKNKLEITFIEQTDKRIVYDFNISNISQNVETVIRNKNEGETVIIDSIEIKSLVIENEL